MYQVNLKCSTSFKLKLRNKLKREMIISSKNSKILLIIPNIKQNLVINSNENVYQLRALIKNNRPINKSYLK